MNPEERQLLERSLKLSEENHRILLKLQKIHKLAVIWGFIKVALVLTPLILGYIFLEPYFKDVRGNILEIQRLFGSYQSLLK